MTIKYFQATFFPILTRFWPMLTLFWPKYDLILEIYTLHQRFIIFLVSYKAKSAYYTCSFRKKKYPIWTNISSFSRNFSRSAIAIFQLTVLYCFYKSSDSRFLISSSFSWFEKNRNFFFRFSVKFFVQTFFSDNLYLSTFPVINKIKLTSERYPRSLAPFKS